MRKRHATNEICCDLQTYNRANGKKKLISAYTFVNLTKKIEKQKKNLPTTKAEISEGILRSNNTGENYYSGEKKKSSSRVVHTSGKIIVQVKIILENYIDYR